MGSYNHFAGQSVERIAALSDGVFAVAMTLLVLDVKTPAAALIHTEADLWQALIILLPKFGMYLMSFLTLGIFWVGQQTQLNMVDHSDRNLAWLNLGVLFFVSLLPFSTALLAEFFTFRVALVSYWLNIFLLGVMLFLSWRHTRKFGLLKNDITPYQARQVTRRIVIAQSLYATGAALCVFGTIYAVAAILLLQLNFVFAPRIGLLWRI